MLLLLLISLSALALDQWTKMYIIAHLKPGESVPVWLQVFHITHVQNPGGAFGILAHHTTIFIILGLALVLFVIAIRFYFPRSDYKSTLSLGLLTGGVSGNLVDRLRAGYVTDFLDFRIWPVFNLADIFILLGAFFLLLIVVSPRWGTRSGR